MHTNRKLLERSIKSLLRAMRLLQVFGRKFTAKIEADDVAGAVLVNLSRLRLIYFHNSDTFQVNSFNCTPSVSPWDALFKVFWVHLDAINRWTANQPTSSRVRRGRSATGHRFCEFAAERFTQSPCTQKRNLRVFHELSIGIIVIKLKVISRDFLKFFGWIFQMKVTWMEAVWVSLTFKSWFTSDAILLCVRQH